MRISGLTAHLTTTLLIDNIAAPGHCSQTPKYLKLDDPYRRILFWTCNRQDLPRGIQEDTWLYLLKHDSKAFWKTLDEDWVYRILNCAMVANYRKVLETIWKHPNALKISFGRMKVLFKYVDISLAKCICL